MSNLKICVSCKESKELSCFRKKKENKDGHSGTCKACTELKDKEYRNKNKAKKKEYDKSYVEKHKELKKKQAKEYALNNKEALKEYYKKWLDENSDHVKKYRDEYYTINKDRISQYKKSNRAVLNEYRRNLKKINKTFALSEKIRVRIYKELKKNNSTKHIKTIDLLGCSVAELKIYLSSKFTKGMSWDNYGYTGWHIDHIKPCTSFDLTDFNQQKECFNYTNLQPLWATREIAMRYGEGLDYIGNLEKGDKS